MTFTAPPFPAGATEPAGATAHPLLPPTWLSWDQPLALHRPDGPPAQAALAWLDTRPDPGQRTEPLIRSLHPAEQALLAALPSEPRRRGFLHGRLAARRALARLLGPAAVEALHIRPGVFGRPEVWEADGRACRLAISISHRDGLACALAFPREQPMGVDLEVIDASALPAIAAQTSPDERALQAARPATDAARATHLTLLWCAHEALGKALGCGLTVPAHFLEVGRLDAAAPPAPTLPGADGTGWRGEYRHVLQYGLHAWRLGEAVLALALPRRTSLHDASGDGDATGLHKATPITPAGAGPAP